MNNWIYKLTELEENVGNLYLQISKLLEKRDPEISDVFFELFRDETQHVKQVEFARNLYSESESIFSDNSENMLRIESALKMITDVNLVIERDGNDMNPSEFLKIAMELEENFSEGHLLLSLKVEDENIKKLLQNMMNEDRIHINRIKRIISELAENKVTI